jgi:hypothetical protein
MIRDLGVSSSEETTVGPRTMAERPRRNATNRIADAF